MIGKVGITKNIEVEFKSTVRKVEERQPKELLNAVNAESVSANQAASIENIKPTLSTYKALWVIDEDNNVFIRIEDEKGNVIKQIPPEEVINLREKMGQLLKNIFNIEV